MGDIRILPPELRNKIAAGEVVERPASVVKELIENSIDAGAGEISIHIQKGGEKLIRVSDDGRGMHPDDLMLCFQPHATSKISTEEDLFRIRTMGFRGEALSSIASVSRMRITSAPEEDPLGLSVLLEGGELREETRISHRGTTVEVRDLFYNTPARKKFLKSQKTETRHIIETVTEAALSHPEIGFRLFINQSETINLSPAREIRERVLQIYGHDFIEGLHLLDEPPLTALFSCEGNFRHTRSHQYIFVNSRPIRDASLRHVVYTAYETVLPGERHPIFFLFIELPPSSVDFNVHPSKREARFSDKEGLYRMILEGIGKTLFPGRSMKPDAPSRVGPPLPSSPGKVSFSHDYTASEPEVETPSLLREDASLYGGIEHIYLGDVFIAYTTGEGIILLDHHAAHERILYEQLSEGNPPPGTEFLFPRQVRLSPARYRTILDHRELLGEMGIVVDDFGENTVIVRSVPSFLPETDLCGIISDIAESIEDITSRSPVEEIRERIAKTVACHKSVRGKVRLSREELLRLLSDLKGLRDPDHCPHGRPTRIHIGIEELKRMFKRI